ncbi:SDR family oxidoreductase [Streptomyces laurentii]|uniref:SDR family oxidoreductase n=1 Tax=Streptomyces laurentii TaxID=39478 RepID=UPI0036973276
MGNFLAGKVVAVTGAGRGIGRAVALACAAHGARVVVNDYGVSIEGGEPTSAVAEAVVKEIEAAGGAAVAVADDISTMAGGQRVVDTALAAYGRIDGVVCVAGILRERMLFNMSEEEWDPVVATHLKGTFTVFRAASAVMRRQGSGTLIGFTSGNHQGSVAQANYSAAKGGIISLVRSAALGLHKYGVTANAVAPVARTRMSANVPMELKEIGEPEDVAALVVYLLSDRAKDTGGERITGQVYTIAGPKIAVWAQPRELRAGYAEGGAWTPERIADFLPGTVGTDPMPMLRQLAEMARAAAAGARPNRTEGANSPQGDGS